MMSQLPSSPGTLVAERLRFRSVDRVDANRTAIEDLIEQRYRSVHGAERCHFLAHLLMLQASGGKLGAALGVERATSPLFLESYLCEPIEAVVSRLAGHSVRRERIVEIGTLVSFDPSCATLLMILTVIWIAGHGADWGVFTATRSVRERLTALGLQFDEIGRADPQQLGFAANGWGTYYENDPRVVAASFGDARLLIRRLPSEHAELGVLVFDAGQRAAELSS